MYAKIKDMADAALKLQNKDVMDRTLRDISAMCESMELLENADLCVGQSSTFIPEKIVMEELSKGLTVLIDGAYVKLAKGDLPSMPALDPKAKTTAAKKAAAKPAKRGAK